jgi:hypothetical protein
VALTCTKWRWPSTESSVSQMQHLCLHERRFDLRCHIDQLLNTMLTQAHDGSFGDRAPEQVEERLADLRVQQQLLLYQVGR